MPQFIDLTQPIYQGMFVYPGHLKTVIWEHHTHEETVKNFEGGFSYQSRGLLMSDHGPTHVDALSHLDPRPEAPSIEKMPLALFYGTATCIDVSHAEPQTYINASDLDNIVARTGLDVRKGDILLFYTGASRSSASIIDEQTRNVTQQNNASIDAMKELKHDALMLKEAVLKGDFGKFADTGIGDRDCGRG